MIPFDVMQKIEKVQNQIAADQSITSVKAIDDLYVLYSEMAPAMNHIESMGFLGGIADMYSQVGKTAKEIPLWETLCANAKADLSKLSIMASSEDIIMTAFDFLRLGRAYRKQQRIDAARHAFQESAKLLTDVDIQPDIELLLSSDEPVFIGEHEGRKFHIT